MGVKMHPGTTFIVSCTPAQVRLLVTWLFLCHARLVDGHPQLTLDSQELGFEGSWTVSVRECPPGFTVQLNAAPSSTRVDLLAVASAVLELAEETARQYEEERISEKSPGGNR